MAEVVSTGVSHMCDNSTVSVLIKLMFDDLTKRESGNGRR